MSHAARPHRSRHTSPRFAGRSFLALVVSTALVIGVQCGPAEERGDAAADPPPAPAGSPGLDRPVVGAAVQPAVEEYRERCRNGTLEQDRATAADERAATCIRVLSGALASVIGRDTVADTPLRELLAAHRAAARRIEELQAGSPLTGELARAVFASAVNVMDHVARTRAGATAAQRDAVGRARQEAEAVDPNVAVRDQWPALRAFFAQAGEAIDALAEG